MENNEILDQGYNTPLNQGGLSSEDKGYLETAAKWSKFLGIMGFIFTGIIVLAGFAMFALGNSMSSAFPSNSPFSGGMFGTGIGILYLLLAAPYFFISLYMYRFATKTQAALYSSNDAGMTEAFKNLRNYFRLMGILVAAILVLYLVALVFGIGAAAMMK